MPSEPVPPAATMQLDETRQAHTILFRARNVAYTSHQNINT